MRKLLKIVFVFVIIIILIVETGAIKIVPKFMLWYTRTYKPYRKQDNIRVAIRYGDVEFLQELLDKGHEIDPDDFPPYTTPLRDAIEWHYDTYYWPGTFISPFTIEEYEQRTYSLVKTLIEHGIDVNKTPELDLKQANCGLRN